MQNMFRHLQPFSHGSRVRWTDVRMDGQSSVSNSAKNVLKLLITYCAERTRIVDGPVSQTVNVNDKVTLPCGADADPFEPLTVEWRRDGVPINFQSSSHLRFDEHNNSLIIVKAAVTDTASYTCHASNGLDEVQSSPATVTVRG